MLIAFVVSFLTGIAASMGLGGGFVLLVYLTAFAGVAQLQAQGINLIFFIPIAVLSLFIHAKNKLLCKEILLPSLLSGVPGAIAGTLLANKIGSPVLSKLFAVFILFVGLKELFHRKTDSEKT